MKVQCVFFTPGGRPHCQVLRALGNQEISSQTQARLEERYCCCGTFIACPIFCRVEQGLDAANRRRHQEPRHAAAQGWSQDLSPTPGAI